jgi:hypothetical protein
MIADPTRSSARIGFLLAVEKPEALLGMQMVLSIEADASGTADHR